MSESPYAEQLDRWFREVHQSLAARLTHHFDQGAAALRDELERVREQQEDEQ